MQGLMCGYDSLADAPGDGLDTVLVERRRGVPAQDSGLGLRDGTLSLSGR